MVIESVFTGHKCKIANYLMGRFAESNNFYAFNMDTSGITLQGYFDSELIIVLTNRNFSLKVTKSGFLKFTKQIANVKLEIVLTQKS